jgi:hypothetical protein
MRMQPVGIASFLNPKRVGFGSSIHELGQPDRKGANSKTSPEGVSRWNENEEVLASFTRSLGTFNRNGRWFSQCLPDLPGA